MSLACGTHEMPLSFLDLPREIRDQIYSFVLISPTAYVLATLQKSSPPPVPIPHLTTPALHRHNTRYKSHPPPRSNGYSHKYNKPPTCVRVQPCDPTTFEPLAHERPLALKLLLTCRQVLLETWNMFYTHNTIVFVSSCEAIGVLKRMGQSASRQLQRICMCINEALRSKTMLARALAMLASRARSGHLVSVKLMLVPVDVDEFLEFRIFSRIVRENIEDRHWSMALRSGKEAGWRKAQVMRRTENELGGGRGMREVGEAEVQRTLSIRCEVPHMKRVWSGDLYQEKVEAEVEQLHDAWGGRLVFNGELVWLNNVRVGHVK